MNDSWINRWDERYSKEGYAYGEQPNEYLKEQLVKQTPGKILFAAEGEGRNAVYAARLGWTVSAFDISIEGKKKANLLAERNKVTIHYEVGQLERLNYKAGQFDAIVLVYAHFPPEIRLSYHRMLDTFLRKGGVIIFEAFSKRHLDYVLRDEEVGGPRDLASLFSIDEIRLDFVNYDVIELMETEVELTEGVFHNGIGSVIRFVGRKK